MAYDASIINLGHSIIVLCFITQTGNYMSIAVSYSPEKLDFSGVYANTSGPDITSDTTDGLYTLINFAGGVHITDVPMDTTVTAHIIGDTSHFMVRDVTVLEWVTEGADPQKLSHEHKGPKNKSNFLNREGIPPTE